jgi:amidohydrolase family protein
MNLRSLWSVVLVALAVCGPSVGHAIPSADIALVGGTVIDVSEGGRSGNDLQDATVLIRGRMIAAVGKRSDVEVSPDARVIDVTGRYLIPGLIDGFSAQRSQGQANAHLAMGVTTIVGLSDDRRGLLIRGFPEPHVKALSAVYGYDEARLDPSWGTFGELRARGRRLSSRELATYVDAKSWEGYELLLVMYPMDIEQIRAVVASAKRHHMATVGELGHASYVDAAKAGVQAFVHMSRIASDLAPPGLRVGIADDPFPANSSALRQRYETFLAGLTAESRAVRAYAAALGGTPVALMPTMTLFVVGTPLDPHNPWTSEIGRLVDPHDVHLPLDPTSGASPRFPRMPPGLEELSLRRSESLLAIQSVFLSSGIPFLAASGATAFGILPGDGLHWEMRLLTRIGLTPRQALAAATSNYAKAYGWADRGQLESGRLADVVVLSANPTVSIDNARSIERIFLAGEELDRNALLSPPKHGE